MASPIEFGNEYEVAYVSLRGAPIRMLNEYEVAYTEINNDNFATRYIVTEPSPLRDIAVNLSTYSMEGSEPNPQTVTKTAWYEYQLGTPPARMHFWVDGATSTGRVVVYRLSDDTIVDPVVTDLVVVAQGQDFWIDPLDDSHPSYYIQVGLKTGAGADLVFHMETGEVAPGAKFATAVDITGMWGSAYADTTNADLEAGEPVPAGITPTSSSWFTWVCPTPAPPGQTFSVVATGQTGHIGVAVYTGVALGSLVSVANAVSLATADASVHWVPVAGTVYHIQITTEFARAIHQLSWMPDSETVAPAAIPQGLVAKVYGPDGVTFLSELPRRKGSKFQESLNVIQSGQVSVSMYDDIIIAYPDLLNSGNVVKFWLGDVCASGFRIQKSELRWVSGGENADVVKTVSGPTMNVFLSDFMVHHDVTPRPDSPDTRYYSWASRPDEWYNAAFWNHKIMASPQTNPPGDWGKAPRKRRRYGKPKKWPDSGSYWYWITNNTSRNGGWNPPYSTRDRYYRREFNLLSDQNVRLFVTGDLYLVIYIDGEEVMRRPAKESGIKTFSKLDLTLRRGGHTLAVYASTGGGTGADGVDAFMLSMYKLDSGGSKDGVLVRTGGGSGWLAYYGPSPQSWNRALVFRNTFTEALERGSTSALLMANDSALTGLKFSASYDSYNMRFADVFNQEVHIGSSGYELQQQLSEGGSFDVWVDPNNLDVYVYNRRGRDRSQSVAIIPGGNVLDWGSTQDDQVANAFLVQFDGGFVAVEDSSSIARYGRREMYVELNGVKTEAGAVNLMSRIMSGMRDVAQRAGVPDIVTRPIDSADTGGVVPMEGSFPFLDYNVGDVISAPGHDIGTYGRMRVMGIACSEDADGKLTFDPDLESV